MTYGGTNKSYRGLDRSTRSKRLDEGAWAGPSLVVASYDVEGPGSLTTEEISFGTVFESVPFFAWGVELVEGGVLQEGDYPFATAGVSSWNQTSSSEEGQPYYLGAFIYISVVSSFSYKLRFRFSFEGLAMRNVEYFRGGS